MHQKNVSFITISFLKMLDLNLKNIFAMDVIFIKNCLFIRKYSAKGATFRCFLWGISKTEDLRRLNNSALEDEGVL